MSSWQTVLISLTDVSWGGLHRNLWVQAAWHEPGVWAKVAVCLTPEEQGSSCLTPPRHLLLSLNGRWCAACGRHVWGWAALNVQVIQGVTLSEMTSVRLVPVESTTIQETMESLGLNFSLDPVVTKALLATKIQNLEEFRFLFEDESKVDTFLAKLQLGDERLIQGSRLRRAWTAVTLYYKNQDQDMLADTELRDVKSNFWVRYRMRFPPEVHPADATLSRISRELSKRMLCVYNLWKVRTLQYQLHTTQKKRKLAEGLYTEEAEDEDKISHDWENYLDCLLTLLLAYAMAGVTPRASVKDASLEKALGADSTAFVEVPLDVVMHYFYRAKRQSSTLPLSQRLAWLEARDLEDRSDWVAKFRESSKSLGEVIKETCVARDAHWVPHAVPGATRAEASKSTALPTPATPMPSQFALGKPVNGKKVAKVMRDGSKVCQAFQHGQCKNPKGSCPQGQHKCGTVVRGERICGMPGHGASQCRAKISPWRGPAGEAGTSAGQDAARPVDRANCQLPRMVDLYAGPNTPLSKAFIFCGWETISVDWMLDSSHDLSNSLRQQSLHEQLQSVCFIAAALDCSTKSRAREIPRDFGDGRPPPWPLRSEKHPLGLPELTGSQLARVEQDNAAASFVLSEIDQLAGRWWSQESHGVGHSRRVYWASLAGRAVCSLNIHMVAS